MQWWWWRWWWWWWWRRRIHIQHYYAINFKCIANFWYGSIHRRLVRYYSFQWWPLSLHYKIVCDICMFLLFAHTWLHPFRNGKIDVPYYDRLSSFISWCSYTVRCEDDDNFIMMYDRDIERNKNAVYTVVVYTLTIIMYTNNNIDTKYVRWKNANVVGSNNRRINPCKSEWIIIWIGDEDTLVL